MTDRSPAPSVERRSDVLERRPPISCYIRTLNEATRMERTVRAARRVAAEVVVVDSGSTDRTVEIAEAAGARAISQPYLGGGNQKRVGEEACRNNWLLDLDADEVVSDELAQEIRDLFADGEPEAAVFRLKLVNVDPVGRIWLHARAPWRAKLYDRREIRMPADKAWDQLRVPATVRVARLSGPLFHHAFDSIGHLSGKQLRAEVWRAGILEERSSFAIRLRVYLGLPFFFLKGYVLRGQWREGAYGFMVTLATSYNHWLRYAMLYERKMAHDRTDASDEAAESKAGKSSGGKE